MSAEHQAALLQLKRECKEEVEKLEVSDAAKTLLITNMIPGVVYCDNPITKGDFCDNHYIKSKQKSMCLTVGLNL